jgi:hypothetical protein
MQHPSILQQTSTENPKSFLSQTKMSDGLLLSEGHGGCPEYRASHLWDLFWFGVCDHATPPFEVDLAIGGLVIKLCRQRR